MQRSEQINDLAAALAKAQAEIEGAVKGNENPHFRSRYADLGAVWEAIRDPLTKHGLSVVQLPRTGSNNAEVETILMHRGGQYISDVLALPVSKQDAQGYGSAITYCRRYALMAVAGIAPVDDDANDAVQGSKPQIKTAAPSAIPPKPAPKPAGKSVSQALTEINACKTKEEIGAWQSANSEWLMKLADQSADKHTHVMNEINARYDAVPSVTQAA